MRLFPTRTETCPNDSWDPCASTRDGTWRAKQHTKYCRTFWVWASQLCQLWDPHQRQPGQPACCPCAPTEQAAEIPRRFAITWDSSSPSFRHGRSSPALGAQGRGCCEQHPGPCWCSSAAGCPTHLYMSIRDRPENCHRQGKPPGPPESPVWVVTAATECRCYPKFWSPSLLVPATARSRWEQTRCFFKKEKNYLVSSLSLPPLKCPTFSPLSSPPLFSWEPGFLSSAWNQSSDFLAAQRDSNES